MSYENLCKSKHACTFHQRRSFPFFVKKKVVEIEYKNALSCNKQLLKKWHMTYSIDVGPNSQKWVCICTLYNYESATLCYTPIKN